MSVDEYETTNKMPDWMKWIFAAEGIPPVFTKNELSNNQKIIITFIGYLLDAIEEKRVYVRWERNHPCFGPSEEVKKIMDKAKNEYVF